MALPSSAASNMAIRPDVSLPATPCTRRLICASEPNLLKFSARWRRRFHTLAEFLVAQLTGKDRLIVALDVPTVDEALRAVEQLDNVTFFKIGLQLFITGGLPDLLQRLRGSKRVFVD